MQIQLVNFSHSRLAPSLFSFFLAMNGWRAVPRHGRIPTISRARKLFRRKQEKKLKSRDSIDRLALHLKVLLSPFLLPSRSRRLLASRLHRGIKVSYHKQFIDRKKSRSAHRNTSKALRRIIDDYYSLLQLECDTFVLQNLLKIDNRLRRALTSEMYKKKTVKHVKILLKIIAKSECLGVRFRALEIVDYNLFDFELCNEKLAGRTSRVLLDLLPGFRARNLQLTGDVFDVASYYWEDGRLEEAEVIQILMIFCSIISELNMVDLTKVSHDEHLLNVIFDGMRNEPVFEEGDINFEASWPSSFLTQLFCAASATDRAFIRGRYADELRIAFMKFDLGHISKVVRHDDTTAYIIENPTLLNVVARRITGKRRGNYDNGDGSRVAVKLLRAGLTINRNDLERMLCLGLLIHAARYFANYDWPRGRDEAQLFRDILLVHPEWNESFRAATATGNGASHTARLGLAIPTRRSNPALYIILDEEVDNF